MNANRTRRPRPQIRPRRRLSTDRGSTTVETVGYTAVWLFALLVAVQAAAWGLAQLSCMYAAQHALQATRVEGGDAAAGHSDAVAVLAAGGHLVTNAKVQTRRGPQTATVTIHGTAINVIPFVTIPVSATASGPVELLSPNP
jgi:hypothetical protein